jgi:hypothetical protein
MDLKCPLCGKFSGTASEVQAHISSKNDKNHKGKRGKDVIVNPADPEQKAVTSGDRPESEKDKKRPGNAQGEKDERPDVECENCGRLVKYPEMMPYKADCPGCSRTMYLSNVWEEVERQADEPGNDETKGAKPA